VEDKLRYVGVALVAGTVGALVALLIAPQSGRDTRKQIRKRYNRERDELARKGRRLVENAEEYVSDRLDEGRRAVERSSEKVADKIDTSRRKVAKMVGI
jgi:gas vesicle protein